MILSCILCLCMAPLCTELFHVSAAKLGTVVEFTDFISFPFLFCFCPGNVCQPYIFSCLLIYCHISSIQGSWHWQWKQMHLSTQNESFFLSCFLFPWHSVCVWGVGGGSSEGEIYWGRWHKETVLDKKRFYELKIRNHRIKMQDCEWA